MNPKEPQPTRLGKSAEGPVPGAVGAILSGVVLAGGDSRRMGRPKAALPVGTGSLLARQLDLLAAAGAEDLIVSARPGVPLPDDVEADPRVRRVFDAWPGGGPLAGIERALQAARGGHLMVLAVDLPAMEAAWLAGLRAGCPPGVGRIVRRDGRFEPLAAVYPVGPALPEARFRLAGGRLRLQEWAAAGVDDGWLQVLAAGPDEDRVLVNWNRPGDWNP